MEIFVFFTWKSFALEAYKKKFLHLFPIFISRESFLLASFIHIASGNCSFLQTGTFCSLQLCFQWGNRNSPCCMLTLNSLSLGPARGKTNEEDQYEDFQGIAPHPHCIFRSSFSSDFHSVLNEFTSLVCK